MAVSKIARRAGARSASAEQSFEGAKASPYERVASMLISLLVLIGVVVSILLVTWLSMQAHRPPVSHPVQLEELAEGGEEGDGRPGGGRGDEVIPPAGGEGFSDGAAQPQEDRLASISAAVATKMDTMEDLVSVDGEPRPGSGKGRGIGYGVGDGIGDGRGGKPRHWEVQFPPGNTLNSYAKQLDFFGIELAVPMPENRLLYAFHLSKAKPDTRLTPADAEKRYYLTWRRGELQQADRDLFARAGVETQGKVILRFLPRDVEMRLVALEKARAGSTTMTIRRTLFGVRPEAGGYAFFVVDQTYF